jgi:3-phenylpropionate/trans-cinnamate dioxygenase ferredoxin subunit
MAEFVKVATVDEVPPGSVTTVLVEDERVAIFNVDGEFYAIADTCTHAESSLSEGELNGYVIECPLHGARFDVRDGRVLSMPAVVGVESFAIKVEGQDLLIGLED